MKTDLARLPTFCPASAILSVETQFNGVIGMLFARFLLSTWVAVCCLTALTCAAAGQPGNSFRDCPSCPELVVVPAGSFMMGSNKGRPDETPVHKVTIAKPFAVCKFEVTFAEWDACVAAGGCQHKPEDEGSGRGKRPVVNVRWDDIKKQYLPWLSRKTGKTYRLLSEAEWEYAARAGTTTVYSWGDDVGKGNANCSGCSSQWDGTKTAPVGSFKANPFGLHDMHGNVWERVQDCHHDYKDAPTDGSVRDQKDCEARVVRGGSWLDHPSYMRAAGRGRYHPGFRYNVNGFRVARVLSRTP
jgi:formylglycine-generating enzyme required for sulfatase activity